MAGKHEEFWKQGDFGYIKKEIDSMMTLCKPKKKVCNFLKKAPVSWVVIIMPCLFAYQGDSSLTCSTNLRHCRAQNLYIDFRRFKEITQKDGRYSR